MEGTGSYHNSPPYISSLAERGRHAVLWMPSHVVIREVTPREEHPRTLPAPHVRCKVDCARGGVRTSPGFTVKPAPRAAAVAVKPGVGYTPGRLGRQ